jgi:hypothetical protein
MLFLLKKNVNEESLALQKQIESKLLSATPEKAKEQEQQAADKCRNLINLINNNSECSQLRASMSFTLEKLGASEHKVTVEDCKALFDYSKVLYEMQHYVCKYSAPLIAFRGRKILVQLEGDSWLIHIEPEASCLGLLGFACLRDSELEEPRID